MGILIKIQKGILIISSILILIGLSLSVTLRYVFKLDLFGIEELLLIPTFLLYFMGAAYGSYESSHITADLVDSYVKSKKIKVWIQTFNLFLTVVICFIITYWSTQYLIWSYSSGGSTSGWEIPLYIPHGTVLIGFILMSFYSLIHLYRQIGLALNVMKE